MPFCTQCGHQVAGQDAFCGYCGARQAGSSATGAPGAATSRPIRPPVPPGDPLAGLSPRTASILCYIPTVGWIAAVIVLAARKFKNDHIVRFHAFQGLYLFAVWLVVNWVVRPIVSAMPQNFVRVDHILEGVILALSIFMMVKASHDEPYVLPIIGELAQRSAAES
jgi:uncharacterized membrane protein